MLRPSYPLYLANHAQIPNQDLTVHDKYSGAAVSHVPLADATLIDHAIAAAVRARAPMAALPAYARQNILRHCVQRFTARREEFAMALCIEAGKPIKDSLGEVQRLIDTFACASEEAVRQTGEVLIMDAVPRGADYVGMTRQVPIGPCSFISPFNFPFNLTAHKIAPAIAVGCPFVLKPASLTPISALLIGEVLAECDLPEGAFSILPARRDGADLFCTDPRLKLLSFTGSPKVGWDLKARAGKKKVILELGGNAACVVDADANVEDAVDRIIFGAFYQSGQSCIKAQRLFVHQSIYARLRDLLVARAAALIAGDPRDEKTFIGPMISESEAKRVESWIHEATGQGAHILCGGTRQGSVVAATLLENVAADAKVYAQEVFGPVSTLAPFTHFDEVLERVNASPYGLQAGVFTNNLAHAQRAWDVLEVGGVLINDVPSFRVDHMPYGGVKDSGVGREGVRYAMHDMTETRLWVSRTVPGASA